VKINVFFAHGEAELGAVFLMGRRLSPRGDCLCCGKRRSVL